MSDENPALINCPNCNTRIYRYNQHVCGQCGDEVCYYCEEEHASRKHPKEDRNAEV